MKYKIENLDLDIIKTVDIDYLKKIINEKTTDKNIINLAKKRDKEKKYKKNYCNKNTLKILTKKDI